MVGITLLQQVVIFSSYGNQIQSVKVPGWNFTKKNPLPYLILVAVEPNSSASAVSVNLFLGASLAMVLIARTG